MKTRTGIEVQLTGTNGNAFAIIGKVSKELILGGYGNLVKEFQAEAMSGDYDHALQTCMRFVEVS